MKTPKPGIRARHGRRAVRYHAPEECARGARVAGSGHARVTFRDD